MAEPACRPPRSFGGRPACPAKSSHYGSTWTSLTTTVLSRVNSTTTKDVQRPAGGSLQFFISAWRCLIESIPEQILSVIASEALSALPVRQAGDRQGSNLVIDTPWIAIGDCFVVPKAFGTPRNDMEKVTRLS